MNDRAFVQFSSLSLAFGDRDILKSVNLNLSAASRAALCGVNGSGKTTLMKVIAGLVPADSGERAVQKNCRVSYLPQSGIVHQGLTLRDEAEKAYAEMEALLNEAGDIGRELASAKEDDRKTAALLARQHTLREAVEDSGYYTREAEIARVLSGLGFSDADAEKKCEEFSGGYQMRIALAKVLLEKPDILLLDEPTNYLDIEARSWLETWLQRFPGGCLLVSHDRYFLDVCVNEVYDLFQGELKRYAGNYSAYEKVREAETEALFARYKTQQEEIAKLESLIERFRYKATKAAFAQEQIKKLEKMERVELPASLKKISITFPPPPHAGRIALTLEGISRSYAASRGQGGKHVLSGLDLTVESGERLLVVGVNGAGKTTLLRIIAGKDGDFSGKVSYGAGISAGYFSQDSAELMRGSMSVLDYLESEAPTALVPKARDMAGAFLFHGDDVYKSLNVLSGGEKSRLALLKMFLKPMNLLILDEPTNHLDMYSKDILLEALQKYQGTVIFVSHDRAFMEALSTKTLELMPDAASRLFYGNYAYYLEKTSGAFFEKPQPPKNAPPVFADDKIADGKAAAKSAKDEREAQKQRQAELRRLQKQEAEIIARLESLEKEKKLTEDDLSKPEVYSSADAARAAQKKLAVIGAKIESVTAEWAALTEEGSMVRGIN
jgi:ATP-binding cassette subfamily F protein 3